MANLRTTFQSSGDHVNDHLAIHKRYNAEPIYLTDAVGDGVTDDTTPMQLALVAAAGKDLLLSPGTYYCTDDVTISDNTRIIGAGGITPTVVSFTGAHGFVATIAGSIVIENIFIDGDDNASSSGILSNNPTGKIVLNHVKITGFSNGVSFSGGSGTIELNHCEITSCSFSGIFNSGTGGSVRLFDCYIHDIGTTGLHHGVYSSIGNDIEIDNGCRFDTVAGYGVHLWGGSGVPEYLRIANSFFTDCASAGILTNPILTTICNCNFVNCGIRKQGTADISGCSFSGVNTVRGTAIDSAASSSTPQSKVTACRFANTDTAIYIAEAGCVDWFISDCVLTGSGVRGIWATAGNFILQDCIIGGTYSTAGVALSGTTAIIKDCIFNQTAGDYELYTTDGVVDISGCSFTGGASISLETFGTANVVTGRDNYFGISINLYQVQHLTPRSGLGGDIASTANIATVSLNYDTYHVTGTTDIVNINLGDKGISGRVYFIADGTWKMTAAGNIIPRTTSARVVGEVVALTHDPSTDIWYEIY